MCSFFSSQPQLLGGQGLGFLTAWKQTLSSSSSSYLSQEELLRLDSCWASSRIFSMSPLWIEDEDGTCSSPPTMASSSSTWGRGSRPGEGASMEDDTADAAVPLFISNSTQDPLRRSTQSTCKHSSLSELSVFHTLVFNDFPKKIVKKKKKKKKWVQNFFFIRILCPHCHPQKIYFQLTDWPT